MPDRINKRPLKFMLSSVFLFAGSILLGFSGMVLGYILGNASGKQKSLRKMMLEFPLLKMREQS